MIQAEAELITIAGGEVLLECGTQLQHVYFPVDGIISLVQFDGIEVAVIGKEGMLGLSALVQLEQSPFRAIVRGRGGQFLRLPAAAIRRAADQSKALNAIISRYFLTVTVQMSDAIAANALYGIEARIARWLLMRHDRVGGDEIRAQHDEIAENLGTRRASITDCLHLIEGASHIRCHRGRIQIRNRNSLEQMVTGCYGAAEIYYQSSFGPFGKSEILPTSA